MSDPVARAREMAELMSNSMNIIGLLALPEARSAEGSMDATTLHAEATAHVDRLRRMLERGGISGPPGFEGGRLSAALDELRAQLATWDPAAGGPGENVVEAARAALGSFGLPLV